MADSVSGWGSYRQCDTERDHFPLESWRFLQIISYCLLISVLSMTCLSSGPACNQIQPAAEVAVWVLCSRGLVFWVCLLGEAIYQHEVFRHSQAHTLLAWSLGSQSLPQSPYCSFLWNLKSHWFVCYCVLSTYRACIWQILLVSPKVTARCFLVNVQSNNQVMSLFLLGNISLTYSMGNFPPISRSSVFSYMTGAPSSELMYEPRCECVRTGMIWVGVGA